jgi:glutathione S-transferase
MTQAGSAFEEVMVRFDAFTPESQFKHTLANLSPAGKVPVLQSGALAVWDTLAIAETLAEMFPEKHLWPRNAADRAHARSICAEMHSGLTGLRSNCPMNIEAHLPEQGALIWRDKPAVHADVGRLVHMWRDLLQAHGGPMLFGEFSIADAYFAPVCTRIKTYALPVPDAIATYVDRVYALPGVKAWVDGALAEHTFWTLVSPTAFTAE